MRARRILFFGLFFGFLLALLYTGERIFLFVLLLLLVVLFVSAFSILVTILGVRAEQSVSPARCEKGDAVSLVLNIRNATPLFSSHLTLWYSLPHEEKDALRSLSVSLLPFAKAEVRETIACPHRGEYSIAFQRAEVTCLFGLISLTLPFSAFRAGEPARLIVEPPAPLLPEGRLQGVMREEISPAAGTRDEDPTAIRDIRLFRQGDPLKRIHWKLSARSDTLYTKEFEGSRAAANVILLDGAAHSHTGEAGLVIEDLLCECAAIFAKSFLYYGRPTRLITYAAERHERSGASLADYPGVADFLARLKFEGDIPLEKAFLQEFHENAAAGVVIVTHRLRPGLCEALAPLAAAGLPVTLVPVLPETRFDEPTIKLLGEFAMRNIRTVTVFPEEEPIHRLGMTG
ncbi:DUF58 domain-containing protein [Oscillospiraceae bacterium OttesenSCG-928-G22]|nr:DUF58 domain-containing protein [Oscillospiraceae bacterium OttesenSCG-928-G22]